MNDEGGVEYASYPMQPSNEHSGLRALSRKKLDYICSLVNCTILSKTSNEYFDAYVLSESSLFVYPQKLLMKTCGTTTLLNCLSTVVQYAAECSLEVEELFYSRQKFIFPDKQKVRRRGLRVMTLFR
jgi:S-adenosylmethionine decarboxylase